MPAPYYAGGLGLLGVVILVGALVYQVWNSSQTQHENHQRHDFNPGPGYDRPRDGWEAGANQNTAQPRKRSRKREECSICQENLTEQSLKKLHCGHMFHGHCIAEWFKVKRTCPTCRRDM